MVLSNRHPNMNLDEFKDRYLTPSLEMSPKANRSIFMLGDFNRDLLKHDYHAPTNEFHDFITSSFVPHILQPTRVNTSSKTLTDHIFSNIFSPDSVSGSHNSSLGLTFFATSSLSKSNIYDRD